MVDLNWKQPLCGFLLVCVYGSSIHHRLRHIARYAMCVTRWAPLHVRFLRSELVLFGEDARTSSWYKKYAEAFSHLKCVTEIADSYLIYCIWGRRLHFYILDAGFQYIYIYVCFLQFSYNSKPDSVLQITHKGSN